MCHSLLYPVAMLTSQWGLNQRTVRPTRATSQKLKRNVFVGVAIHFRHQNLSRRTEIKPEIGGGEGGVSLPPLSARAQVAGRTALKLSTEKVKIDSHSCRDAELLYFLSPSLICNGINPPSTTQPRFIHSACCCYGKQISRWLTGLVFCCTTVICTSCSSAGGWTG